MANTERLRQLKANNAVSKASSTTQTGTVVRVTLRDKVLAWQAVRWTASSTISSVALTPWVTNVAWVDMNRVRSTWLTWYNGTRADLGLSPYSFDARLDTSAHAWNIKFAEGKWLNHHRRSSTDSYYNYNIITEWFRNQGVVGKVVGWATTTENVGYGYYNCNSSDCTDELISSIRTTYDFFMSEKWKSYDPHYRSIVQPNFTEIGLDIIVVPSDRRYYVTVHYITEFK